MSASLEERFAAAFAAELADHPDVAPGPSALNRRLGLGGKPNNINGRLSRLRTAALVEAGFVKDYSRGYSQARWVRS